MGLLITKALPALDNSVASAIFMDRLQTIADRIGDGERHPDLTTKQTEAVKKWVVQIQAHRDHLHNG